MGGRVKRTLRITVVGLGIAIFVWFVIRLPFPIEGFWCSPLKVFGTAKSFFHYNGGKVLHFIENDKFIAWCGNYERTGWGRYQVHYFWPTKTNAVVFTSIFSMRSDVDWVHGDRIWDSGPCQEMLNRDDLKWYYCLWERCLVIDETPSGEQYFFNGVPSDIGELEERLVADSKWSENFKNPLQIYANTNFVPPILVKSLEQNNFEYVVYTNQQWVPCLEEPYVRVAKTMNATQDYSVKFAMNYQHDLQSVGLEMLEDVLRGTSDAAFRWVEPRPHELAIVNCSSCEIGSLVAVMNRQKQPYKVITNDMWIEKTDPFSWALIFYVCGHREYCCLNGLGYNPAGLDGVVGKMASYRARLETPLVIYAASLRLPAELTSFLESKRIVYTIKPLDILINQEYTPGQTTRR